MARMSRLLWPAEAVRPIDRAVIEFKRLYLQKLNPFYFMPLALVQESLLGLSGQ